MAGPRGPKPKPKVKAAPEGSLIAKQQAALSQAGTSPHISKTITTGADVSGIVKSLEVKPVVVAPAPPKLILGNGASPKTSSSDPSVPSAPKTFNTKVNASGVPKLDLGKISTDSSKTAPTLQLGKKSGESSANGGPKAKKQKPDSSSTNGGPKGKKGKKGKTKLSPEEIQKKKNEGKAKTNERKAKKEKAAEEAKISLETKPTVETKVAAVVAAPEKIIENVLKTGSLVSGIKSTQKAKTIEGVTTSSTTNSKAPKPKSHANAQKAVNSITKKLGELTEGTPEHTKLTSQLDKQKAILAAPEKVNATNATKVTNGDPTKVKNGDPTKKTNNK